MSGTHRYKPPRKWHDHKPRTYLIQKHRTCQEKRSFPDEIAARVGGMLSLQERRNTSRLWVYRCPHCERWHLTSKERGPRWLVVLEEKETA